MGVKTIKYGKRRCAAHSTVSLLPCDGHHTGGGGFWVGRGPGVTEGERGDFPSNAKGPRPPPAFRVRSAAPEEPPPGRVGVVAVGRSSPRMRAANTHIAQP